MKKMILTLLLLTPLFGAELTLMTEDGYELHGWLDKPKDATKATPIVLLAHQFGSDHTSWESLTKKLNEKGMATLSVDLRGHGKSVNQKGVENKVQIPKNTSEVRTAFDASAQKVGFDNIPQDLIVWLDLLSEDKSLDMSKLYLMGASLGGSALIPVLNDYDAKALIALSAGKSRSSESDMALSSSMSKTYFIATKNDPLGASTNALEYGKKAIAGTTLILSGDGHGTVLLPKVEEYIWLFLEMAK
ncbi:MAG: Hydrolase, alpha/beta fold family protein [uncultured Sulfurovum sp.]|uniref:Hydrolase, alpha/beta fold family protein n=1 Tax=uncultured Sulfurovum sp. TaxID=269237 RepID=A0A6S6U862_9BACT|nr:MAG: Hydrolase, alpha/beta fold family protein [uncultured Sulfurovum sp.]